ncbi:thiolase family protein [Cryptosporangium sp. NPDC051539]|uniref:thiolase family protein n=1 Tax=Cryptosporangium sp. NPDC051539 TaxID=3363962 RepID=UPI0037B1658C
MGTGAAFIGVGYSAVDRRTDRSLLSYAHEASLDALRAAGIAPDAVDGYVGIGSNPNPSAAVGDGADHVSAYLLVDSLGLGPLGWVSDVSGFAVNMAATAAAAIRAGSCSVVLGVRAVSAGSVAGRTRPGGPSSARPGADESAAESAGRAGFAAGEDQWTRPFGAGPPGTRFALRMRQYLERSGATRSEVFQVVRAARAHAANNPVAYFRNTDVMLDEYLDAPMVADPLSRLDCDLPVTGAGAFVLVSDSLARDRPAAYLRAHTNWTNADTILDRAGLISTDIDVCQLYDGYSFMVYEWLERLGWCDENTAWKFVADGHTRPGGDLPVNTFGGALGEGRLHGMGHLREGIVQVMGVAGARQVDDVEHCLVQIGPFDRSALAVLSREGQ